jgi:hypothetical protein
MMLLSQRPDPRKLVMQLDRDVQVCGIFFFAFLNTPCVEILLLLLFSRGVKDRNGEPERGGVNGSR